VSGVYQRNVRAETVVIGSGPGGATTAHILAEAGREVVMFEEGSHLPLESCSPFSLEEMVQKYRAGGLNPVMGKSKVAYVEGRTVGGGSEINSGLYHRTPPDLLDLWRTEFQTRDTLEHDLLPHFHCNEHALSVSKCPGTAPLASRKLALGAKNLGWHSIEVPRWFRFDGSAGPDGNPEGTRQSMTKTFVPRAIRAGARLVANTRISRIERSGTGWKVHATSRGKHAEVIAENVFVCGGAVQTPALLRRSGITRNTGNTLAIHPTVKVVADFDEEVNHEHLGVGVHQVKEFAPGISFGCSVTSLPYLALALADLPDASHIIANRWRNMAVYYAMITGPHTGRIRSIPGSTDPLIRYNLAPEDWRNLATGMRHLVRLLLSAGARKVYPCIEGAQPISAEDELTTIPAALSPERSNLMTIHLFSSCPMGENKSICATDSMGRVHGMPQLHVNDASLIPTAPGLNPQGTVMALARRNTLHFLGSL
jgi:choline dehydrogenase-like flavoprotein